MKTCSFPLGALRTTTSSPVRNHRPPECVTYVSLVALSLRRYPRVTAGPLTHSSPGMSYVVTSFPSVSTTRASMPVISEPDEPSQMSSPDVVLTTVDVSVRP